MTRRHAVCFLCFSLFSLSGLNPRSAADISWDKLGLCPPIIWLLGLVVVPEPDTAVTNEVWVLLYCTRGGRDAQKAISINASYKYESTSSH